MIFYQNGTMWQLVKLGTYLQYIPYVTQRALEGLFSKVTDKEKGIRKNINERISPLLQKVFGQLDKK